MGLYPIQYSIPAVARFLMTYLPSGIGGFFIAIGSFGLRPKPSVRRIEIWSSFKGVSQDMFAKRSACASAGVLSTLEMHLLMEATLWGDATASARGRVSWDQWLLSKELHNRRHRGDSTLSQTIKMLRKEKRRVLNHGRTISNLLRYCIRVRVFSTRKSISPFGLQGASFGAWHLCNEG